MADDVRLDPATPAMPLPGLVAPIQRWWERRLVEILAERGFDDVRPAHVTVSMNLPAEGMRLTDLAETAGMSKQAMAELVDDLVGKGYLRKEPDPSDGRAKLLRWDRRGLESYEATLRAFSDLEEEVERIIGPDRLGDLRSTLGELAAALR